MNLYIPLSVLFYGAAYVAGAFTPAIGRKIKALWVKKTTEVKQDVTKQYDTVKADVAKKL